MLTCRYKRRCGNEKADEGIYESIDDLTTGLAGLATTTSPVTNGGCKVEYDKIGDATKSETQVHATESRNGSSRATANHAATLERTANRDAEHATATDPMERRTQDNGNLTLVTVSEGDTNHATDCCEISQYSHLSYGLKLVDNRRRGNKDGRGESRNLAATGDNWQQDPH